MRTQMKSYSWMLAAILCGCFVVCAVAGKLSIVRAQAQTPSNTSATGSATQTSTTQTSASAPEMNMHDSPVTLQTQVNLVPVRVVVRDQQGRAVSNLSRDDFRLLEDGKPQDISHFAVETLASLTEEVVRPTAAGLKPGETAPTPAFLPPSRFVALLFDDVHTNLDDLMRARNAASRYIDSSLAPTDRAAIFTISGQNQADFTDDRDKLHAALRQILPRSMTAAAAMDDECPPMEFYEADAILNQHDSQAEAVATSDALACLSTGAQSPQGPSPADIQHAEEVAQTTARGVFERGDVDTQNSFRRLRELTQRLEALPGQRTIVLISPGFIYPTHEFELSEILDGAIRANVFISTLDARGLWVPELGSGDISKPMSSVNPQNSGFRTFYRVTGDSRQIDLLIELANATGGSHFENNNDLDAGLREVASPPEAYYMLGFTPQNLKFDGRFHSLSVKLVTKQGYTVQSRRGFYAPKHGATPADTAAQDIEEAVFSQEEQHGLPVTLQTQFYKTTAMDATLAVLAHVDLAHVQFNKLDGRNQDDLTVVAALFDRNGNFVTGTQKMVEMKLRDATLDQLSQSGITVRTNFAVKPGDYVVRLVVRDSKAALVSAENGVVEIPY
jgi:VWFA-related protein